MKSLIASVFIQASRSPLFMGLRDFDNQNVSKRGKNRIFSSPEGGLCKNRSNRSNRSNFQMRNALFSFYSGFSRKKEKTGVVVNGFNAISWPPITPVTPINQKKNIGGGRRSTGAFRL